MRKKILAIVTIVLCLVTMAVPCFAYTSNDLEGANYWIASRVPWDTFRYYQGGVEWAVPFPYTSVSSSWGNTDQDFPNYNVGLLQPDFNSQSYAFADCGFQGSYSKSSLSALLQVDPRFVRNDATVVRPTSMENHYGFSCTSAFTADVVDLFGYLDNSYFYLSAGASCRYTINVDLLVPYWDGTESVMWSLPFSYDSSFVNTTSTTIQMLMFPTADRIFTDMVSELAGKQVYVNGISWDLFVEYPEPTSPTLTFTLPYVAQTEPGFYHGAKNFEQIWNSNSHEKIIYRYADADLTTWLSSALGGLWNAEFFPGFTFGGLAAVLIGVGCLAFLIKWWLGG